MANNGWRFSVKTYGDVMSSGWHGMQGGGVCQHQPQGLVAASSAPASLLGLINASQDVQTVSACLATLNNLCALEEGADRVFEEAKRFTPHVSFSSDSSVRGVLR